MKLNKDYWQQRYQSQRTGWDMGGVSPPIGSYIDQLRDKNQRILIPGAGMGYEAEHLARLGFRNFTVLDIAPYPLSDLRNRLPDTIVDDNLVEMDFFKYQEGPFDLILEHTFFCALDPKARPQYVLQMNRLLKPGGKLVGLFFDFPLTDDGPPYGGSREEYETLFDPYFYIRTLERAYNSISPRAGSELFFIFEKK